MRLEDEILVNKYGQSLVEVEQLTEGFKLLGVPKKREYLNDILYLIMQSKSKEEDVEQAIIESGLKSSYTPCVLLRKGVKNYNLEKLVTLPKNELSKVFVLLLSLFRIAYRRRFVVEKDNPNKWWYWDLSDNEKLETIRNNP